MLVCNVYAGLKVSLCDVNGLNNHGSAAHFAVSQVYLFMYVCVVCLIVCMWLHVEHSPVITWFTGSLECVHGVTDIGRM